MLLFRARAGSLETRELEAKLGGEELDDTCGICGEGAETLQHIFLDCVGLVDLRDGFFAEGGLCGEDRLKVMLGFNNGVDVVQRRRNLFFTKGLLLGWWERRGREV